ncbi:hypothetical protein [Mesorhizobium sp. 113-3-9]|nr:hypothetical protein [Mesorhizobium sp. 113-3-9]
MVEFAAAFAATKKSAYQRAPNGRSEAVFQNAASRPLSDRDYKPFAAPQ